MTEEQGQPELEPGLRKSKSSLGPRQRRSENWGSGNRTRGRKAGKGWRIGVQVSKGCFQEMDRSRGTRSAWARDARELQVTRARTGLVLHGVRKRGALGPGSGSGTWGRGAEVCS